MESAKTIAKRIADSLPDDATWQQFLYRVELNAKIANRLEGLEQGKGIPHEVVMKEMDECLESSGHLKPVAITK